MNFEKCVSTRPVAASREFLIFGHCIGTSGHHIGNQFQDNRSSSISLYMVGVVVVVNIWRSPRDIDHSSGQYPTSLLHTTPRTCRLQCISRIRVPLPTENFSINSVSSCALGVSLLRTGVGSTHLGSAGHHALRISPTVHGLYAVRPLRTAPSDLRTRVTVHSLQSLLG